MLGIGFSLLFACNCAILRQTLNSIEMDESSYSDYVIKPELNRKIKKEIRWWCFKKFLFSSVVARIRLIILGIGVLLMVFVHTIAVFVIMFLFLLCLCIGYLHQTQLKENYYSFLQEKFEEAKESAAKLKQDPCVDDTDYRYQEALSHVEVYGGLLLQYETHGTFPVEC